MSGLPEKQGTRGGRLRLAVAILIGLAGATAIWLVSPYSDFVIGSSFLCDSYLPVAGMFVTLVLVLGVNPLLKWLWPRLVLNRTQLGLIMGILLTACILPGQGLLRVLPYWLVKAPLDASTNARLAGAYEEMDLPPGLFPSPLGYEENVPESEHFVDELPMGESIPWEAWLQPLLTWGVLLVFMWLMMIGLAQIVLPQWRNNERLPFPLLAVQESLIEPPDKGRFLPPIFLKNSFWLGAGIVFVLHLMVGLNRYYPGAVPAIPINWNLSAHFTEGPFRYAPHYIRASRIYFLFLGIAFFMPGRIGFSIWFFQILYAAYVIIVQAYRPPLRWSSMGDHRMGAMIAMTVAVLWLGRAHWGRVFRCLVRRAASEEDSRDQKAGMMFLAGCAGMWAWLMWAGVQPLWAAFLVAFGFMISLTISRIVVETGMAFVRLQFDYHISLVHLAPTAWLSLPVLYFARVIAVLFAVASRTSCATVATHVMAMDKDTRPGRRWRIGVLLVMVLGLGVLICGASHLHANYHNSMTRDGSTQPLNPYGMWLPSGAHGDITKFAQTGSLQRPSYNRIGHIGFGVGLAAVLELACLAMPRWPLHPVGLLMAYSFYSNEAWASVFLGWLLKTLVLRYGGSRAYRAAFPLFLGVIVGEVFAAAFWAIDPAVRVALGLPYKIVQVQPY